MLDAMDILSAAQNGENLQPIIAPVKREEPYTIGTILPEELTRLEAREMLRDSLDRLTATRKQIVKARQLLRERLRECDYIDDDTIIEIVWEALHTQTPQREPDPDDQYISESGALFLNGYDQSFNRLYPPCSDNG